MIQLLKRRNFALLWTAGLISMIGDWAFYAAMPIFVFDQTGSAFLSGLVWAAIVLPGIAIGPLAGVFVDRWDRRRIMIWGNIAQVLAASSLLLLGDSRGVWLAMAIVLIQASLYAVYSPAESALLPTLVEDDHLPIANSLNSLNDNIARVAGPLIGAFLYAWFGIRGIALGNMVSFAGSAVLVGLVVIPIKVRPDASAESGDADHESLWDSFRIGVGIVWHDRILRSLFLIIGSVGIADGPLVAMLAPFIRDTLDRSAEDFGTFLSVRGVSGIVGGLVVAQVVRRARIDRFLAACLLIIGIQVVIFAIAQNYLLTLFLMVLVGPAIVGQTIAIHTMLQQNSADAFRGRLFSLMGAFWGIVSVISISIGSAATAFFSPTQIIAGSGVLYILAGFGAMILLFASEARSRQLEDSTTNQEPDEHPVTAS